MRILDKTDWHQPRVTESRRRTQRGSALLIVFVFAAIVAIMLYRELPIAAFEAQRQKEELLVSRGEQYKRGIKLFVRKVGRFPNSINELESTNRMRFLRHRYLDPFTGKEDWRIVHAGPGGVIIDSQVKTNAPTGTGASTLGQGATFAGFNNTFTGDATAVVENAAPSAGMRQRSAATKNAADSNNDQFALPGSVGDAPVSDPNAGAIGAQPVQRAVNGTQIPITGVTMDPNTGLAIVPTTDGTGAPTGVGAGISSVAQQLNNVNPRLPAQAQTQQQQSAFGNTSAFGTAANSLNGNAGNGQLGAAGGIAGVASIAAGKSIKTVNDQTKYKLWEFYYDLRKDQSSGAQAIGGQQNLNGNAGGVNNGGITTGSNNSSGFGQTTSVFGQTSSGFGQTSSGFGQTQQQGQSTSGFGGTGFGGAGFGGTSTPSQATQPTQQVQQQPQ